MTFKKEDEIILVVPRHKLFKDESLTFQGSTSDKSLVQEIMNQIEFHFTSMRRGGTGETEISLMSNAELNFDFKQPIPYIVIRRGKEFFVTERLEGGGESRLHGKLSMGAGGHMNPLEGDYFTFSKILAINTERELEEELDIKGKYDINIIGLINDDSDTVGQVHIGILGFLELEEDGEVSVLETEQLKGTWYTIEQLRESGTYGRLENWGKIVVDMI